MTYIGVLILRFMLLMVEKWFVVVSNVFVIFTVDEFWLYPPSIKHVVSAIVTAELPMVPSVKKSLLSETSVQLAFTLMISK